MDVYVYTRARAGGRVGSRRTALPARPVLRDTAPILLSIRRGRTESTPRVIGILFTDGTAWSR